MSEVRISGTFATIFRKNVFNKSYQQFFHHSLLNEKLEVNAILVDDAILSGPPQRLDGHIAVPSGEPWHHRCFPRPPSQSSTALFERSNYDMQSWQTPLKECQPVKNLRAQVNRCKLVFSDGQIYQQWYNYY